MGGRSARRLSARARFPSSRSQTLPDVAGSRLPVGSSAKSNAGLLASATADGDALLLTAGKLRRAVMRALGQPQPLQQPRRARAFAFARPGAGDPLRQGGCSPPAPSAPAAGGGTGRRSRYGGCAGGCAARRRRGKRPRRRWRRRRPAACPSSPAVTSSVDFPRAGRADKRDELALLQRQRCVGEHRQLAAALAIGARDMVEDEHVTHSAAPPPGSRRAARRAG